MFDGIFGGALNLKFFYKFSETQVKIPACKLTFNEMKSNIYGDTFATTTRDNIHFAKFLEFPFSRNVNLKFICCYFHKNTDVSRKVEREGGKL